MISIPLLLLLVPLIIIGDATAMPEPAAMPASLLAKSYWPTAEPRIIVLCEQPQGGRDRYAEGESEGVAGAAAHSHEEQL